MNEPEPCELHEWKKIGRETLTGVTAPEAYVDAHQLAELMGVSASTIKRWVAEGIPSETWGMSRTRRFQPSVCIAWARDRERRGGVA